jgi:hypothetical protein
MIGRSKQPGFWTFSRRFGSKRAAAMRRYQAWKADNRGASIIIFALSLPILIGFIGLGVETSYWYLERRELQEAVDSAALAGAFEKLQNGSVTQIRLDSAAGAAIARSGFSNPTTITISNPPVSGIFIGDSSAVEAVLKESYGTHFAAVLGLSTLDIETRAVAKLHGGSSTRACILSLEPCFMRPNEGPGIIIQGSTDLQVPDCAIHSSDACQGIDVPGNPTVDAECITASGDVNNTVDGGQLEDNSRNFTLDCGFPQIHQKGPPDPYAGINLTPLDAELAACGDPAAPDPSGDGGTTTRTFQPGRYCAMNLLGGNGEINYLMPGIYYVETSILINGGSLESAILGDGSRAPVIFIQPDSNDFDFRGQGNLYLVGPRGDNPNEVIRLNMTPTASLPNPPDSGDFIQDDAFAALVRYSPTQAVDFSGLTLVNFSDDDLGEANNCPNKLNGDGVMFIDGTIYYPKTCVVFTGNASTASSNCFQLIGGNISLSGNFGLSVNGCSDSINLAMYPPMVGLVE